MAISKVTAEASSNGVQEMYDLSGRRVSASDTARGIYIVKDANGSRKIMR